MSSEGVKICQENPPDAKMNKTLLNSMYRRRMSCPHVVQQLWDAVKVIRYQRQVANLERIAKYMLRVHSVTEEEVSRQLGYCVRDGLLVIIKRKGLKGSKIGVEQEGYKLPESPADRDKHDWYCSECHTGGDVIPCGDCHRVYHLSCINNLPGTKQKYLCSVCQGIEEDKPTNMKHSKMNRLLYMACVTLKERYGPLINTNEFLQRSINIGSPGAQIDIGAEAWRVHYLIHKVMDLTKLLTKSKEKQYSNLSQFCADAHTIVHNVVIFHGVHSHMADSARQMLRDCMTEVNQIRWCTQCYEASILKPTRHWFCIPCKPPHQLVYAKAKGYPYSPAKVVRVQGEKYDVVFFGPEHWRATVDKSNTMPITTSPNTLQVKRTSSWNKACEELKRHQDLIKKQEMGEDSDSSSSDESVQSAKSHKVGGKSQVLPPSSPCPSSKEETLKENEEENEKEEEVADHNDSSEDEIQKKLMRPVRKKRGRPPKSKPQETVATPPSPKKRRGRPPSKKKAPEASKSTEEEEKPEDKEEEEEEKPSALPMDAKVKVEVRAESPSPSLPPSKSPPPKKNEEEIVSSSCMEPQVRCFGTQTKSDSKKEKTHKEIIGKLQDEIQELKATHAEEIKQLTQSHAQDIAATKKKQWCYNCEQEAIYHCCWNTAYCSTECQQLHWQREHKRVCRRKR